MQNQEDPYQQIDTLCRTPISTNKKGQSIYNELWMSKIYSKYECKQQNAK